MAMELVDWLPSAHAAGNVHSPSVSPLEAWVQAKLASRPQGPFPVSCRLFWEMRGQSPGGQESGHLLLHLTSRVALYAMENLAIAQYRDQLRYAYTRGEIWKPKVRKFDVGDYVYLHRKAANTLEVSTSRVILRVVKVGKDGVLELEGSDGRRWKDHLKNSAPCHLPNLDPQLRPTAWRPPKDLECQVCGRTDDDDVMLLCDRCNRGTICFVFNHL